MSSVMPATNETDSSSSGVQVDGDDSGLQELAAKFARLGHTEEAEWLTTHGRVAERMYIAANIPWSRDFETVVVTVPDVRSLLPDRLPPPPALPLLDDPPYRIAPIPGKGLGMLAVRAIPAGTPIALERPSIVTGITMPNREHGASWQVPDYEKPGTYSEEFARRTSVRADACTMAFMRLGETQRARLLELYNCKPPEECGKEEGIIRTNQFGIHLRVPEGSNAFARHRGVFLDMSRANHSCSPNVGWSWDVSLFTMLFFSLRDINEGDELTISYIDPCLPRAVRQSRLNEMYLFDCTCKPCSKPADARAKSDARREEMKKIEETLDVNALLRRWIARAASAMEMEMAEVEREFLKPLTSAYNLYAKEDLHGKLLQALCSNTLVKIYKDLGNRPKAVFWTKKAIQAWMTKYWEADALGKRDCMFVVQKHKEFINAAM